MILTPIINYIDACKGTRTLANFRSLDLKSTFMFNRARNTLPASNLLLAAAYHYADRTISSPTAFTCLGAYRFENH